MQYKNIFEWICFLLGCSTEKILSIIDEKFSLENYVVDIEVTDIDSMELLNLKNKFQGTKIENLIWEELLQFINPKLLPNELIDYFIENEIALSILGHLPLDDMFLWKLVGVSGEAILTLGKRYYLNDVYTNENFTFMLEKFKDNYELWNMLLDIIPHNGEKRKILIKNLFIYTNFEELKRMIIEENIENMLKKTQIVSIIKKKFACNNYRYLRGIAQNPITPISLLENLTEIKDVKYAKQIRDYAKANLTRRVK